MSKALLRIILTCACLALNFLPITSATSAEVLTLKISEDSLPMLATKASLDGSYLKYTVEHIDKAKAASQPGTYYQGNIAGRSFRQAGFCSDVEDQRCRDAEYWDGVAFLPRCESARYQYCIESVRLDGQELQFVNYTAEKQFDENPRLKTPAGYSISIWRDQAGNLYELTPSMVMFGQKGSVRLRSFGLEFSQVQETEKKHIPRRYSLYTSSDGAPGIAYFESPSFDECIKSPITGNCLKKVSNLEGNVSISARLGNTVPRWTTARITNPNFRSQLSTNQRVITVSGKPMDIPTGEISISADKYKSLPEISSAIGFNPNGNWGGIREGTAEDLRFTFATISKYEEFQSRSTQRMWKVSMTLDDILGPCFSSVSNFGGYVATNATMYSNLNPTIFNGELVYQVSSPHLDAQGQLSYGRYELQMPSKIARCLYKLSSAPIQATISVTDEKGMKKIATTVAGESGGNLMVSAFDFTYSSPLIKIKVSQAPSKIVCQKSKSKKTITGINPTCPSGYKKVA